MKKILLFLFIWTSLATLNAQERPIEYNHTKEVWTGFTLKKDLNKKFSLNFDEQVRITEGSQIRVNFMEAGIKYKFIKKAAFKVQYRYSFRNDVRNTSRLSFDLSYKWKIKPANLQIKYRARFQNTVVDYTGQSMAYFRNRLIVTYKYNKKWSTYAYFENFYRLNERNEFRANRYEFGANYNINKQFELKTFLQYDYEINVKSPSSRRVIGVLVKYEFD